MPTLSLQTPDGATHSPDVNDSFYSLSPDGRSDTLDGSSQGRRYSPYRGSPRRRVGASCESQTACGWATWGSH
jgi:hypothetical protein